MKYDFTLSLQTFFEQKQGGGKSRMVETRSILKASPNLDQQAYFDAVNTGMPTKQGCYITSLMLIEAISLNIYLAHEKGHRDSAEHFRWIISELEKKFVELPDITSGTWGEPLED